MSHPENRFIDKVHRKLRPLKKSRAFYYAKIQVSGNNGWPDCYYSGDKADLWAEYKWVSQRDFPKRDATQIKLGASKNQRSWLQGRHSEGRSVCLIIGSPYGHVVLVPPLPESISRADFMFCALDTEQLVGYIRGSVLK